VDEQPTLPIRDSTFCGADPATSMLDSSMGLAIQSTLDPGIGSTTLEFKMSFLRPITPETGPIRAEGTVISRLPQGHHERCPQDSDGFVSGPP
jgi:Thioesterase superfamily